jgi:hypothetical protein
LLPNVSLPADGTYRVQVKAATGHAGNTGNYVLGVWNARIDVAPVLLNQPTVGVLDNAFNTDRWTFSSTANQQVRFQLLNAADSATQFDLTGPNGFTGFSNLSTSSELVTLPAAGTYTLSAHTTGGGGGYGFQLQQTALTDLASGVSYQGTWAGSGQAQLFHVNLQNAAQLLVTLQDPNSGNHNEIYLKHGAPPTRSDYQYRYTNTASANQQILAAG